MASSITYTPVSASLPKYELADVKKHDSDTDAWMVIDGFVHDVTEFLYDHPGGKDIMCDHLGKDASDIFMDDRVHAHGAIAYKMLAKYRIGVLNNVKVIDRTANEDLNKLVDLTKPILPQIDSLGAKYNPWVHSQMGLKSIIIFDNFLENLSHYPWWYIFLMWPPFIAFCLYTSMHHAGFLKTLMMFPSGALSWAMIEYVLHRWVFHMYTATTFWNKFHFFAHGIHHLTPNDASRLTFPPTFSVLIASLIYQLTHLIRLDTGVHGFFAGLAFGFMLYDAIHYYFHHGDAPWLPEFLKSMKSAHLNHHYKDDTTNFGVTSQLFDFICGTKGKTV